MKPLLVTAVFSIMALGACGNDSESSPTARILASVATDVIAGEGAPAPGLTRAMLANVVTPVQRVTREATGQQALVANVAVNQGVQTWSSVDKVTVSFRQGVLVATRGFGGDLMAADVPGAATLFRGSTGHTRAHTLLDGTDQPIRTVYVCSVTKRDPQDVVIVGISYRTTHVVEACSNAGVSFQNEFWFDGAQGVRKSRQWVGPDAGYLISEDLRG